MIDEKKLIKVLRNHVEHITEALGDGLHLVDLEMAYDELSNIVNAQQRIGEWIPVSERLPEEDRYILLSFENFTIPQIGRYETDDAGGAFHIGDDDETCVQQDLFVNAWMPLPEPWEGEK